MDYIKYEKTYVMMEEENHSFANDEAGRVGGGYKNRNRQRQGSRKGRYKQSALQQHICLQTHIFRKKKRKNNIYGSGGHKRYGSRRGQRIFQIYSENADGAGNELKKDYSIAVIAAVSLDDGREPLRPVARGTFTGEKPSQVLKNEKKKAYSSYYKRISHRKLRQNSG